MPSYSQGSQGLSVLPQAHGIFTANSISLSLWSRQEGNRYAIRAGRNLPAKEFRYLRTVIVTAAVYWGFDLPLRPEGLTAPLNLPAPGRRQTLYVLFHKFAGSCVFDKQSLPSGYCGLSALVGAKPYHACSGTPSPEVTAPFCRVP